MEELLKKAFKVTFAPFVLLVGGLTCLGFTITVKEIALMLTDNVYFGILGLLLGLIVSTVSFGFFFMSDKFDTVLKDIENC